jgi:HK97 gp10 family phage protein
MGRQSLMGDNPSVKKFRSAMQDFAKNVATNFHSATLLMADEVVSDIKAAAPELTGHLKESIRKRDVSTDTKISVLVIGGGDKTTRRASTGTVYDYAIATEFGTQKESPQPFFYSTYRAYKAGGLQFNKVRGLQANNYSNDRFTRSVGHRGAVVIQRGRK